MTTFQNTHTMDFVQSLPYMEWSLRTGAVVFITLVTLLVMSIFTSTVSGKVSSKWLPMSLVIIVPVGINAATIVVLRIIQLLLGDQ